MWDWRLRSFDIPFLGANVFRFFDGGYVPGLIGAALIATKWIWNRGRTFLEAQYSSQFPTCEAARQRIVHRLCTRLSGSAVFIAPGAEHVPSILVHFVQRCRPMHETVTLLTVTTGNHAHIDADHRYELTDLQERFWRLILHFGYMEKLEAAKTLACVVEIGRSLLLLATNVRGGTEHSGSRGSAV